MVSKLKCGKAAGPDGLMAEHLKAGGEVVVIWLLNVLNTIVELEVIKRASLQGEWEGPTVGRQLSGSDVVMYGCKSFGVSVFRGLRLCFLRLICHM